MSQAASKKSCSIQADQTISAAATATTAVLNSGPCKQTLTSQQQLRKNFCSCRKRR